MKKSKALAKIEGPPEGLRTRKTSERVKSRQIRKRGRPTLTDAELAGRREELVYLLETHWPKIGWQLNTSRLASDIPQALEPIRGNADRGRIGLLLRTDSVFATPIFIRKILKTLEVILGSEWQLQQAYDKQLEACKLAEAGMFEAGPENRLSLKTEITNRLKNIPDLEKDCVCKERILRNAEKFMRKMESASQQRKSSDLHGSMVAYQAAKQHYERAAQVLREEKELVRRANERLRAASPTRLDLAKKIATKHQQHLQEHLSQLAQIKINREQIENTLRDYQAGFAQAELLRFIRSKRTKHTPRNLANAIAGMPEITARVSLRRCRKVPFAARPGLNFELFTFFARCLRKRTSMKEKHILELFRLEIDHLPRTKRIEGKEIENFFRKQLEENWWALKRAIIDVLKFKQHPGELRYILTDGFLTYLFEPQTNLDRLLHEIEN